MTCKFKELGIMGRLLTRLHGHNVLKDKACKDSPVLLLTRMLSGSSMAFEMPIIASASSKNLLPSSGCIKCGDTLANEKFFQPTLIG